MIKRIIAMPLLEKFKEYYHKRYLNTGSVFCLDLVSSFIASMSVVLIMNILIQEVNFGAKGALLWLGLSLFSSIISFGVCRVYRAIIRYSTLRESGRLCIAVLGKEFLMYVSLGFSAFYGFASNLLAGMLFVDFFVTLGALILMRVLMVAIYDNVKSKIFADRKIKCVLVYGVSDKAASMVSRLRNSPHYKVTGFITYGKRKLGHQLAGLNVAYFEDFEDINRLISDKAVDGILFPYVADARSEQDRLVKYCQETGLKTYIMPGIDEMTEGKSVGSYIRKIKIEDLLGRPEIRISMDDIIADFKDKIVLVTGAAGSIGSELCRQLASFGIRRLILFDNAETPLHNIRLELEDRFPDLDFVPVIGDVRSLHRLDYVFHEYGPQIVFHAAAYKHVPLMEENPCEAVMVNVTGSRQVADKCVEYGVEKMVMVSTDKAVNPTNIMGCTKRLAEIYVQSLGLAIEREEVKGNTKFITTRFGTSLDQTVPSFRVSANRLSMEVQ